MPTEAETNAAIIAIAEEIKILSDSAIALASGPPPAGITWDHTGVVNSPTFSNSDLTVAATGLHLIRASAPIALGERHGMTVNNAGSPGYLGICLVAASQSLASPPNSLASVPSGMWCWRSDRYKVNAGASLIDPPVFGTGDKIMLELTAAGEMQGYKNGTLVGTIYTGLTGGDFYCAVAFFGSNGSPVVTLEVE